MGYPLEKHLSSFYCVIHLVRTPFEQLGTGVHSVLLLKRSLWKITLFFFSFLE